MAQAIAALLFVERGGPPAPSAGWRASPLRLSVDGAEYAATVRRQGGEWIVDGRRRGAHDAGRVAQRCARFAFRVSGVISAPPTRATGTISGSTSRAPCVASSTAPMRRRSSRTSLRTARCARRSAASSSRSRRKPGDRVRRGQTLATVEAMKMQYSILAPIDGVIAEANAVAGRADALARAAVRHRAARRLTWTRPSSPAR